MVINRANSGVSVADMERTIGMPSLALIRSAGLQLVKAANEGRTVIDMFPKREGKRGLPGPRRAGGRRRPRDAGRAGHRVAASRRSSAAAGSRSAPEPPARRFAAGSVAAATRQQGPRRLHGPPVDLVDAAQVGPVDEHDVDLAGR